MPLMSTTTDCSTAINVTSRIHEDSPPFRRATARNPSQGILRLAPPHSYCSAVTSNSVWPSSLALSIAGPGKVGASLARWAVAKGATLEHVAARHAASAHHLASELGAVATSVAELSTEGEDLLLVAVSDDSLEAVVETLSSRKQARVVLHTSGRLDASVLEVLRDQGSKVGTFHPLMAFPAESTSLVDAQSVVFGIDGDSEAVELARRMADGLGGSSVEVDPEIRPLYHLAATLAAGGIVTLLACASDVATQLGMDPAVSRGYLRLAEGAIKQASASKSLTAAITGPIARGEMANYLDQVERLRTVDPELAEIVERLAHRTQDLLNRSHE